MKKSVQACINIKWTIILHKWNICNGLKLWNLTGEPAKQTQPPENVENIPIGRLHLVLCHYRNKRRRKYFESQLLCVQPYRFTLHQWKAEKGWFMMHFDTSATHSSLVHNVLDSECTLTQIGSICDQVLWILKCQFFNKQDQKLSAKLQCAFYNYIYTSLIII